MSKLLAKSEPPTTLREHIDDGLRIWKQLKYAFPKATEIATDKFWDLLYIAVIFHDLGKGHSEFQEVLKGNKDNKWYRQRHELFSMPFISALPLRKNEKQLVQRVVAGHHKTYSNLITDYISPNYPKDNKDFKNEFSLVDQEKVFKIINSYKDFQLNNLEIEHPSKVIRKYKSEVLDDEIADYFTTLILFGAFKHCDHLASAYVKKLNHLYDTDFNFLTTLEIELKKKGFNFYKHQTDSKTILYNVILTAPTGSGKTETAMLWLRNQMAKKGQGRVFYTLPFTASINAMFRRLGKEKEGFGLNKVGMLHGKLSAFLYDYFQDESSLQKRKEEIKAIKAQFQTLETPLKVLTPFQLLKHIFGLKGFEKGIFEWTGGYFIFDEIHAYDASIFAQIKILLEFLSEKMNASIFIMTATLPTFIKKHIQEAIGSFEEVNASEKLYASFDRHRIIIKDGLLGNNISLIKNDLNEGKKVLVVCNTVEQAQIIFNRLDSFPSILIHGGFNGRDRNKKEKDLDDEEPQLLIGTQAIEVSLDIDYDIIYTEPAPLDALIQRFGRVNRKRAKDICDCVVFNERNEKDEYIYKQVLIDNTLECLEKIKLSNEGIIKEGELQKYIDIVYPDFDEKSQLEFETTYNSLKFSVENNLIPFEHSKDREIDFYKQFDGIKVVPAILEDEYKALLSKYDFIGAELLKVQIRKGRFAGWMQDGSLEKDQYAFVYPNKRNKPIIIDYFVLKKKYYSTIGLVKEEDEKRQLDVSL